MKKYYLLISEAMTSATDFSSSFRRILLIIAKVACPFFPRKVTIPLSIHMTPLFQVNVEGAHRWSEAETECRHLVRLDLKFLLVNHSIVLKPAISMLAIRVAMCPMNDATLCIPFVYSVELDFIA